MTSTSAVNSTSVVAHIPHYLENIIDKKIHHVALSRLEKIVDWALCTCSCFYPAYHRLYQQRLVQSTTTVPPSTSQETPNSTQLNPTTSLSNPSTSSTDAPRELHFVDGTPLYDRTAGRIAEIYREQRFNLITQTTYYTGTEYITLNGHKVMLSCQRHVSLSFRRDGYTDRVTVENIPDRAGWFRIHELELVRPGATAPEENSWEVDTNKVFVRHGLQIGQLAVDDEDVYVIENLISSIPNNEYLERRIYTQTP